MPLCPILITFLSFLLFHFSNLCIILQPLVFLQKTIFAISRQAVFFRQFRLIYTQNLYHYIIEDTMFWTPELASYLEDAPWPATKEELIDYCSRTCAAQQVIDNLLELEDNDELYEGMEDLWPEYESAVDDLYFNEDEENDDYY